MSLPVRSEDNNSLRLELPLPLTRHPAAVYLAGLGEGSRRTIRHCLNTIAKIISNGECDCLTLDWARLRYHHTAAVRVALAKAYAPVTANKMLSALRRVLLEAYRLDLISATDYQKAVDLRNLAADSEPRGRCLSQAEIAAIIATCDSDSPLDVRDRAIIALLRGTGIRRSELVKLELADLDPQRGEVYIRKSKRGKNRRVYLPPQALSPLTRWLRLRGDAPGALFCRIRRGGHLQLGRMHPDAIWRILQKRGRQAGLPPFSPHDLRRTFCSDLLDAGVDLVTVQKLAGHASPVTTANYDRRGEDTLRRAIEQLDF